ncbi:MAG TPA: YcaO-like family protein [Candidatus Acidoferrales bacterium]|nr:YcaO-like family protein [Candidatus Acidoferrales bacterium]
MPLDGTFARLPALRRRFGVTRLGDTTLLDRTGIPTATAIVPAGADVISVYNGKGTSRRAAYVGAVMEALERQVTAAPQVATFRASVRDVLAQLNLHALGLREDALDFEIDCVWGTDLLAGRSVAVPLANVQCPWYGTRLYGVTSTNGLASGNTMCEAAYHALCEMVERHVWALHHTRSRLLTRVVFGPGAPDRSSALEVRLPTGCASVDELARTLAREGVTLRLFELDEGSLPHVMTASVYDPHLEPPMLHMGFGCSLSPEHAALRAITEAVQCRVSDIQAAREDLLRPDDPSHGGIEHGRRSHTLPAGAWFYDAPPRETIDFATLTDRSTPDLAEDLRRVVEALRHIGVSAVVAVDMTPGETEFSVVRTIVPELETLTIDGRFGRWTSKIINPFLLVQDAQAGAPPSAARNERPSV